MPIWSNLCPTSYSRHVASDAALACMAAKGGGRYMRVSEATTQSSLAFWRLDCDRRACHRARIHAARWLAMTEAAMPI